MSEQLTKVTGRVAQYNNASFFIVKAEDIDAATIMSANSDFTSTSLKDFLAFENFNFDSEDYPLYIDTKELVVSIDITSETSAVLGTAVLGQMVLGQS